MNPRLGAALLVAALLALSPAAGCRTDPEQQKRAHLTRAEALVKEGKYADAALEYRNALKIDGKLGEAHFGLSTVLERQGDLSQALLAAVRAADMLPARDDAQLRAGKLLLAAGQFRDAKARADIVLARNPVNVDALMISGAALANLKDTDAAVAELEQATKLAPDEAGLRALLGSVQRASGNLPEAEKAFKNAVQIAPKSVEALFTLANYYWSIGQLGQSEDALKRALALEPQNPAVHRSLAALYVATERDADAESALRTSLQLEPGNPGPRLALADVYSRQRAFDKVAETLKPLEGDKTSGPLVASRLAVNDFVSGRRQQAYERLDSALKSSPGDADLRSARARLLLDDHRFKEAEQAARATLEVAPQRYEGHYVLGSALLAQHRLDEALASLRQAAQISPRHPAPKLQMARVFLEQRNANAAVGLAEEALTVAPRFALAHAIVARAYMAQGQPAKADQHVNLLVKSFPNSPDAKAQLGSLLVLKRDAKGARSAYEAALKLDPRQVEALGGLATLELQEGRTKEAIALVEGRFGESPDNPDLVFLAGETYARAKDWARAEGAYKRVVELAPDRLDVFERLGRIYFVQNRLDEARKEFETMAARQPGAAGPGTMVGIIHQLQGRTPEARAAYERLLQANPNSPVAANNLAMILVESGENVDVALGHAQTAKRLLPTDPDIADTLGQVYLKKGLADQAMRSFEECTTRAPGRADCWLNLADARAQAGKKAEALAALDRAVKTDPSLAGSPKVGQIHAVAVK